MTRGRSSLPAPGQFASAPMLLSQQFLSRRRSFGRGYGGAEISGEQWRRGLAGNPFRPGGELRYLNRYQLYGFLDTGASGTTAMDGWTARRSPRWGRDQADTA